MSQSAASTQELSCCNLFSVKGLIVVITGGGTGIGLMIAKSFAANGAKVYIIGRRLQVLQKTAETHASDTSGEIIPLQGDVTSKSSIEDIVKQIHEREGYINVLFNNAGVAGPKVDKVVPGSGEETKENLYTGQDFEDWNTVFETNVASVFFVTSAFLGLLTEGGKRTKGYSSTVINISSVSGLTKNGQSQLAYNTSKAAVIHMSKMMAKEFAGLKIRVNTIAPGLFPSEMTTEGSDEGNVSEHKGEQQIPAGRAGDVKEMAGTALYLASKAGLYTNGAVIPVDGGMLLSGPSAY
ncbi:hypothetical protein TWF192_000784 [Orbilia oligospora]|uniref:Uncharacterized protein n=1 Tax=Orbilia oligospora TaxID=2813651 RepID=A0A6G1LWI5_ORBOL|nr:hypothetical protein TWF191_007473 [Orbilia oligospora]KAF3235335.1 hypothetical protein TWF192_000784 [Orbilia oligospora]